ncbi:hypothetical protein C8R43DRAFT_940867 [Mycena crocata]|nr:hypothetical protein C8R43DRAFT_940867 [Mycena crocata]
MWRFLSVWMCKDGPVRRSSLVVGDEAPGVHENAVELGKAGAGVMKRREVRTTKRWLRVMSTSHSTSHIQLNLLERNECSGLQQVKWRDCALCIGNSRRWRVALKAEKELMEHGHRCQHRDRLLQVTNCSSGCAGARDYGLWVGESSNVEAKLQALHGWPAPGTGTTAGTSATAIGDAYAAERPCFNPVSGSIAARSIRNCPVNPFLAKAWTDDKGRIPNDPFTESKDEGGWRALRARRVFGGDWTGHVRSASSFRADSAHKDFARWHHL